MCTEMTGEDGKEKILAKDDKLNGATSGRNELKSSIKNGPTTCSDIHVKHDIVSDKDKRLDRNDATNSINAAGGNKGTELSIKSPTTATPSAGGDLWDINGQSNWNHSSDNNEKAKSDRDSESSLEMSQITQTQLEQLSSDRILSMYNQLCDQAKSLKRENSRLKELEEKSRLSQLEASRRESLLVMRLATKEQEVQDCVAQINEFKSNIIPNSSALRNAFLDPAVNYVIQKMKKELQDTKKKLEDTQNDLSAWKFTPDSNTGKRLMAKCRMLHQENEDLGKMITSGRLAKLESDLALQKSLTDEMKRSQLDMDELVQELDEDIDGMQSTILYLQQKLKISTDKSSKPPQKSQAEEDWATVKRSDLCSQCASLPSSMEVSTQQSSSLDEELRELEDGKSNSSPYSLSHHHHHHHLHHLHHRHYHNLHHHTHSSQYSDSNKFDSSSQPLLNTSLSSSTSNKYSGNDEFSDSKRISASFTASNNSNNNKSPCSSPSGVLNGLNTCFDSSKPSSNNYDDDIDELVIVEHESDSKVESDDEKLTVNSTDSDAQNDYGTGSSTLTVQGLSQNKSSNGSSSSSNNNNNESSSSSNAICGKRPASDDPERTNSNLDSQPFYKRSKKCVNSSESLDNQCQIAMGDSVRSADDGSGNNSSSFNKTNTNSRDEKVSTSPSKCIMKSSHLEP